MPAATLPGRSAVSLFSWVGWAMSGWVYILGERKGATIKIGRTDATTVGERIRTVNGEQMSDDDFVLLAALRWR